MPESRTREDDGDVEAEGGGEETCLMVAAPHSGRGHDDVDCEWVMVWDYVDSQYRLIAILGVIDIAY